MKIAIIGAGVSGLTAAYLLSNDHAVTMYEKADRLGGHANTVTVNLDGNKIPVDTGFMVYNPEQYPNFIALTESLGIESVDTTMSFGVNIPGLLEFRGNFPNGVFARRRNVFNRRYLRFLHEIIRFRKAAKHELATNPESKDTLEVFLEKHNFSNDFANWFLYPMLSAVWSISEVSRVGAFPAISSFVFLNNHRLLNQRHPTWKTIKGGSIQYVERLASVLRERNTEIKLSTDIASVTRSNEHAKITFANGSNDEFDYVLFATHADVTKRLLGDLSNDESKALDYFTYSTNKTVLHGDTSVLPQNKRIISAWNYKSDKNGMRAVFTYSMNILQHIAKKTPMLVTLNSDTDLDKSKIYATETYEHPQYSHASLDGQAMISALQGQNHTLYAGAHLGYGFHEDGVVSAINAVAAIGVSAPWKIEA